MRLREEFAEADEKDSEVLPYEVLTDPLLVLGREGGFATVIWLLEPFREKIPCDVDILRIWGRAVCMMQNRA